MVLYFIGHKLTQLHVSWSPFLSLFHLGNPIKLESPRVVHVLLCGTSPTTEADHMHRMVWCGVVWCGVVWCGVVWCFAQQRFSGIMLR